ncbi:MAG: hypothetical protein E7384_06185 [Ruminococcaceae bacterium]|nr:hypothetical protein [Oscillospiraceae bacterium]
MEEKISDNENGDFESPKKDNDRSCKIRTAVVSVSVVAGIILLLAYGIYFNIKAEKNKAVSDNHYQQTFYDLLNYLEDTENYIFKAMVSGSTNNTSKMLDEAWKNSVQAEACIAMLPLDSNLTSNASKYLVQMSDMARSWSDRAEVGLSDDEYETLNQMYGYAQDLSGLFEYMAVEVINNPGSWDALKSVSSDVFNEVSADEKYSYFNGFTESFNDYPTLIYDGPFSDTEESGESKDLPGNNISQEAGASKIEYYFKSMGQTVNKISFTVATESKGITVLNYDVSFSDTEKAYVALTEDGGHFYSISMFRDVKKSENSVEEAINRGAEILKSMGMSNMKSSYYQIGGNCITVNYCYQKGGILYYPDMVKLKLSLEDGSLLGYEAHQYLLNHFNRKEFSEKDAVAQITELIEKLSPNLTAESGRLCVTPGENGGENFAYEVKCQGLGHTVLVYYDAITGEEKDILILIDDETGTLTV